MYRKFKFEGDVHDSLWCVPLTVRRKLDLAALKISLEGWQALPHAERLALCHLPTETAEEIEIYRELLQAFCARVGVPLKPLEDADAEARTWNSEGLPERVRARVEPLGATLDDARWRSLDEETRYAILKLTHPKRNPVKLPALLVELGLLKSAPELEAQSCAAPAATAG